jgi:hypothetical protein
MLDCSELENKFLSLIFFTENIFKCELENDSMSYNVTF